MIHGCLKNVCRSVHAAMSSEPAAFTSINVFFALHLSLFFPLSFFANLHFWPQKQKSAGNAQKRFRIMTTPSDGKEKGRETKKQ